jgi:hypothetical protein
MDVLLSACSPYSSMACDFGNRLLFWSQAVEIEWFIFLEGMCIDSLNYSTYNSLGSN